MSKQKLSLESKEYRCSIVIEDPYQEEYGTEEGSIEDFQVEFSANDKFMAVIFERSIQIYDMGKIKSIEDQMLKDSSIKYRNLTRFGLCNQY